MTLTEDEMIKELLMPSNGQIEYLLKRNDGKIFVEMNADRVMKLIRGRTNVALYN